MGVISWEHVVREDAVKERRTDEVGDVESYLLLHIEHLHGLATKELAEHRVQGELLLLVRWVDHVLHVLRT